MPISVIIAAKNAESTIEECLDSVRRNNPAEIIVVDGNSSDKTVKIAAAIIRVLGDEALREELVTKGKKLVGEKFNWSQIATDVLNSYNRVKAAGA